MSSRSRSKKAASQSKCRRKKSSRGESRPQFLNYDKNIFTQRQDHRGGQPSSVCRRFSVRTLGRGENVEASQGIPLGACLPARRRISRGGDRTSLRVEFCPWGVCAKERNKRQGAMMTSWAFKGWGDIKWLARVQCRLARIEGEKDCAKKVVFIFVVAYKTI